MMYPNTIIPATISLTAFLPNILWGVFFLLLFAFVAMTLILLYHWSAYGDRSIKMGMMGIIYLAGGVALLLLLFLSVNAYLASL